MGDLGFEIGWKIDDVNGAERTFLGADTATDTQTFRDICNFGLGSDFDAQLAGTDDGTGLFAFLPTFLWFALVTIDNSNSSQFVRHGCGGRIVQVEE